ncbi:MAG: Type 1 glutamine amidotransferase-like domain-containing protein [Polyangiaceae bacterium]
MTGSVYLAASSHEATLREMASRVAVSVARRPIHIAASYAAAGGPMVSRMDHFLARLFVGAKVTRFTVDGERDPMPPREARAVVESADLLFLGGGDPVHGARLLVAAGADAWLRDARARGAHCLGISAGAIMLAAWWADWPDHPPPGAPYDGGELVRCTGVVTDLVVDCHAEEDHWSELHLVRGLLGDRGAALRFLGLPTGTGIVVAPDGAIASIGGEPVPIATR